MKVKSLVAAMLLTSGACVVYANTTQSTATQARIQTVDREMQTLQTEMQTLHTEVKQLNAQLQKDQAKATASTAANKAQRPVVSPKPQAPKPPTQVAATPRTLSPADGFIRSPTHSKVMQPKDSPYLAFGNAVVLAPSIGTPAHYDGSSFLINAPSVNTNRYILERTRQELDYYEKTYGRLPPLPALILSGDIVGIGQYANTYNGKSNSDIDLTNADIDAQAAISPWVTGLMELSYDNSPAVESTRRINNSRIFLNQGFLTIGNFRESPWYGTLGQFYVPFGRYSSIMISSPLTLYLGRTKARAAELGYYPSKENRPYAEAFAYRGAATTSSDTIINNGGIDLGYHANVRGVVAHFGASVIRNIADSDGMQDTGASSGFQGFNESSEAEKLSHVVPALDLHGNVSLGNFTLIGEYVDSVRRFATEDISFNNRGARPSAYTLEGDYSFNLFHRPMTFGVSYGESFQALGFNVPSQRFMTALQMAVLRYTLLTIEFRHDINYANGDTSTHTESDGSLQNAFDASTLGKSSNTITAQLGVYF